MFRRSVRYMASMNNSINKLHGVSSVMEIPKIVLSEKEAEIVGILNKYTSTLDNKIVLRITGGWVRDKLLNKPSHDIDIGIEGCSGENFVLGLKEWLNGEDASKIHKIKKNPEKSKHLETCTTKLCGLDVDFVNLRSEKYTEDSRIPNITEGTPVEDAFRRDATLNALFFNLSTMEVEDLTGSGINDLHQGILRTPLDPIQTFLDDPLRCLRLIRFASTYGFKLEENAIQAMKLNEIQLALKNKISRERIGVEFKKIIENKRGIEGILYGLSLIREVGFSCIFDLGDTPVEESWENEHRSLIEDGILNSLEHIIDNVRETDVAEEDLILFYCSLILNKWGKERVKIGKKENYVSYYCTLNGIKMPLKIAENVSLIIRNIGNEEYSKIQQLSRFEVADKFIIPFGDKWIINLKVNKWLGIDGVKEVYEKIEELKLENIHKENLLINGKEIMQILNRKAGPWLRDLNNELFKYQINNPGIEKDQLIEFMKSIV